MQKSLVIIKPCVQGIALQTQVLTDFLHFTCSTGGHKLRLGKLVFSVIPSDITESIYDHVSDRTWYPDMAAFFLTRRSYILSVYGDDVIRKTMAAKHKLRTDYTQYLYPSYANFIHCSDSLISASRELSLFSL